MVDPAVKLVTVRVNYDERILAFTVDNNILIEDFKQLVANKININIDHFDLQQGKFNLLLKKKINKYEKDSEIKVILKYHELNNMGRSTTSRKVTEEENKIKEIVEYLWTNKGTDNYKELFNYASKLDRIICTTDGSELGVCESYFRKLIGILVFALMKYVDDKQDEFDGNADYLNYLKLMLSISCDLSYFSDKYKKDFIYHSQCPLNVFIKYIKKVEKSIRRLSVEEQFLEPISYIICNISKVDGLDENLTKGDKEVLVNYLDNQNNNIMIQIQIAMSITLINLSSTSKEVLESANTLLNKINFKLVDIKPFEMSEIELAKNKICFHPDTCFHPDMTEEDVLKTDCDGNNMIHLTAKLMWISTCKKIINISGKCLTEKNNQGQTALMGAIRLAIETMKGNVSDEMIQLVECLISKETDIQLNMEDSSGKTVIQNALEAEDERLILTLTKSSPFIEKFTKQEIWFCLQKKFYKFLETHLERILKQVTEKAITPEVFFNSIDVVPYNCLERMYIYSKDTNKSKIVENMLYIIYKYNGDMNLFHNISKMEIDEPQLLKNGETILSYIIKEEDTEIFEDILMMRHSKRLVNTKNADGYLPIHLAITSVNYDFVASLIPSMTNMDESNIKGESALYLLIKQLEDNKEENERTKIFRLIKTMISLGGNIYLRNRMTNKAPIEQCRDRSWKYKIEKTSHEIRPQPIRPLKASATVVDEEKCPVCTVNAIDCIFKCGHKFCVSCGFRVHICPICREGSTNATRITFD